MPPKHDKMHLRRTVLDREHTHVAVVQVDGAVLKAILLKKGRDLLNRLDNLRMLPNEQPPRPTYLLINRKRNDAVLIVEVGHFVRVLMKRRVVLGDEILGDNISRLHLFLHTTVSHSFYYKTHDLIPQNSSVQPLQNLQKI